MRFRSVQNKLGLRTPLQKAQTCALRLFVAEKRLRIDLRTAVEKRIRRVDHKTLVDDFTIEDPKAYTKSWTASQTYHKHVYHEK